MFCRNVITGVGNPPVNGGVVDLSAAVNGEPRMGLSLQPTETGFGASGATYNSPVLYFGIPHTTAITGNSTVGTGVDPSDEGGGTIFAVSYREFRLFRRMSVQGAFTVFSSRSSDRVRFDPPVIVNNSVTAQSYTTSSDRRLKDNIILMSPEEGMAIIAQVKPVSYTYKVDGRHAGGVIAQEMQDVMPWAVREDEDGMLSVDYDQLITPLAASAQHLNQKVESLESHVDAQMADLERQLMAEMAKNARLEQRLEALEAALNMER